MVEKFHFAAYQDQIFLAGVDGKKPRLEILYARLEAQAKERITRTAYGYVAGGAGSEDTMDENLRAFRRRRIVPRMLRDVSDRAFRVDVAETSLPAPLMLAPLGVQSLLHPEAETATARGAAAAGIPFVLSTASSRSMEEVAQACGDHPRWFQLYWPKDWDLTESFLERARRAGYSAVVVTLDTRLLGFRPRDLREGFNPFLRGQGLANYLTDPVFVRGLPAPPEADPETAVRHFLTSFSDKGHTWSDLKRLREVSPMPLLVKGILHPDDARAALDCGVDGIIVSNHGGRQVDGAIGALDALPSVASAVEGRADVLFDSGIRSGADMFKALALGAKACLIGRPFAWGLAAGGSQGVTEVLACLLAEFDLTMALCGCRSPEEIDASFLTAPR